MRTRVVIGVVVLAASACKTAEGPTGQGGARFSATVAESPSVPLEALFGVCWPPTASAAQRVTLTPQGGDLTFEVRGGASNSVGWCLREIATSVPAAQRLGEKREVAPPTEPLDLWAALAWVKLLAPGRFGPERGLLDPAPLAAACMEKGVRAGLVQVEQTPVLTVRGLPPLEAERCLEAVLGSTAWPSPKELTMRLSRAPKGQPVGGEVSVYFAPESESGPLLDPQLVRGTMRGASSQVSACWNEALVRRAGLGGARTFRFRTGDAGQVTHAWVASSLAEGPVAADFVLDGCLARVVRGLRFPGGRGDGLYTWVFATR
ncbi:MAG: hypothetical protein SFW67_01690 [Myxococcaceae bacterium]|nr:hypothetical protein [Myxococcaceae bacterium]